MFFGGGEGGNLRPLRISSLSRVRWYLETVVGSERHDLLRSSARPGRPRSRAVAGRKGVGSVPGSGSQGRHLHRAVHAGGAGAPKATTRARRGCLGRARHSRRRSKTAPTSPCAWKDWLPSPLPEARFRVRHGCGELPRPYSKPSRSRPMLICPTALHFREVEAAREKLGAQTWEQEWAKGRALPLAEAISSALGKPG